MKIGDVRPNYREQLLKARSDLLSSLGMKVETIASMGRVSEEDQAQASHEEFVSLRLNGLDYEKLKMVDEALDRIGSGEYGTCLSCEEAITPRRLKAVPWARYCVQCQDRASLGAEEYSVRMLEVANF